MILNEISAILSPTRQEVHGRKCPKEVPMEDWIEALSLILKIFTAYTAVISIFFLLPRRKIPRAEARTRFAVLLAARNEEAVIGRTVQQLLDQHYPRELFDVYVIPNNCTDDTEGVARRAGAQILPCLGTVRNKGDALHGAFAALKQAGYDAYCVFDADNLVDPDFLARMNDAFCAGAQAAICFSSKERIVQIEGEAYFDVAPDKEHPFIVKTSHTSIRVTGTSFNVRAYADEDTESTTLISGTVRINSGNEEFELVPNQHYTYNKNTGTNTVANVNTDLYTSWESGSFIFLNVPLENVMSYLSKWYGFQYSFEDEAAKQVRIGAYLNRYANMNPIIDMITELNLVNIKQREGILHISYKQ